MIRRSYKMKLISLRALAVMACIMPLQTHAADPTNPEIVTSNSSPATTLKLDAIPLGPLDAADRQYEHNADKRVILSSDARRIALIATRGSRQSVYIDGQQGPEYREIVGVNERADLAKPRLLISPDNQRVAYLARKEGNQVVVVVDQVESPAYDEVGLMSFDPVGHRLVYIAQRGTKQFLVDNGTQGPACDQITSVQFSPDGTRLAYVGKAAINKGAVYCVMVDGRPSPLYSDIKGLIFSADSKHVAYVAVKSDLFVVIDGKAVRSYGVINMEGRDNSNHGLVLSRDGAHVAYVAQIVVERDGKNVTLSKPFTVIDGQKGAEFERIGNIVISPDGRRIAYIAQTTENGRAEEHVVENGKMGIAYDSIGDLQYSPDSTKLVYFVRSHETCLAVVNGDESEPFRTDVYQTGKCVFSGDGQHMAFFANKDGQHVISLDGKIFPFTFKDNNNHATLEYLSDGRLLYGETGSHGFAHAFIVGDAEGTAAASLIALSQDGKHEVKIVTDKNGHNDDVQTLWLDGQRQNVEVLGASKVLISEDGLHYAFLSDSSSVSGFRKPLPWSTDAANFAEGWSACFDGRYAPRYRGIDDLAIAPDGKHLAFVAKDGNGTFRVIIDGFRGPRFERVLDLNHKVDGRDSTSFLRFYRDESLQFLAVMGGNLYRCRYSTEALASMPKFEGIVQKPLGAATDASSTDAVGSGDDINREGRGGLGGGLGSGGLYHGGFGNDPTGGSLTGKSEEEGNPDFRQPNSAMANAKSKNSAANQSTPEIPGFHNLFTFTNIERQGIGPRQLVATGNSLFGLASGGKNHDGVLFEIDLGNGDFSVAHNFTSSTDGYTPTMLMAGADGNIYGTMQSGPTGHAGAIFRYQPGKDLEILEEGSLGTGLTQPLLLLNAITSDNILWGLSGQHQIFRFSADSKELQPLGETKDWGPFVDGGDGYFYGSNWDGLAKIKYSSGETKIIYAFGNGKEEIDAAPYSPIVTKDGMMFGFATKNNESKAQQFAQMQSKTIIFYRVRNDGTKFTILGRFDRNRPSTALCTDGNAIYGYCDQGLFKLASNSDRPTIIAPAGRQNPQSGENLLYYDGSLYFVWQGSVIQLVFSKNDTHKTEITSSDKPSATKSAEIAAKLAADPTAPLNIIQPKPLAITDPIKWNPAPK